MSWLVDLSIGPVQGFVSESRRTRDLWASSYLLSFLAAHAMVAAEGAGGTVHAVPDDPMYSAVRDGPGSDVPRIGTVPNHFQVTATDDPRAVAVAAEDGLHAAWQRVCVAVWDRYVEPVASGGDGTHEIWQRQVGSFWQVTWVAGQGGGPDLLTRRKRWRSHRPPDEPGDKCTVMPRFQEVSGHIRATSSHTRFRQDTFWAKLRERTEVLALRADERLCAVALVKRLFPVHREVAQAGLGWSPETGNWPSTVWIGALPWLHTVHEAAPKAADGYARTVQRHAHGVVRPLPAALTDLAPDGQLARLDANYLHRGFVADRRLCPLPEAFERNREQHARDELGRELNQLYRTRTAGQNQQETAGGPPVYYALLRADGDRLGRLAVRDRELVGRALADFAQGSDGVEAIIHRHSGVTIYAGGDDVLAMLPIPGALQCAATLADRYQGAFARLGEIGAHMSAAILFAHVRLPLVAALTESQRLLEEVAKHGNGRNSLAIAVLKPGTRHCEWVTHWWRTGPDGQRTSAVDLVNRLTRRLDPHRTAPGFSSSLLYRTREALSLLCGWPRWEPGKPRELAAGVDAVAYLRAEIRQSLAGHAGPGDENAEAALDVGTEELTSLVWPLLRRAADRDPGQPDQPAGAERAASAAPAALPEQIILDPLLLARFLSRGGHEEEHL